MKRRNADCSKIRRQIKRNKIAEGMYGSNTILYIKFLILWAIVITADFMFMFRFEFLWPFWLLLRSVHDSFKYKGLAFSVLFVCIAITSDLVCLFFIPVNWLLFAASTYVWVQYVWHTDKGICLPTIILWMLFVYLEAGIRWKDTKHMPHLDLCRPFAAHCIGYPVVTLGFGFKSYVGYRMRQRKQREVAKENEFYMQLLHQALPQEESIDDTLNNTTNGIILPTGAVQVAQTVQTNSFVTDNGHINTNHDDKNHTLSVGILSNTTSLHQQTSNNHHNNNLNNSFNNSCNKNAQINSKLNNIINPSTTSNGHIVNNNNTNVPNNHKNHRRSMEKEKNDISQSHHVNGFINISKNNNFGNNNGTTENLVSTTTMNTTKISNSLINQTSNIQNHSNKDITNNKEKEIWENCNTTSLNSINSSKELKTNIGNNINNNDFQTTNYGFSSNEKKGQMNGNIAHYDIEEIIEAPEKVKSKRNRGKRDTSFSTKDNHQNVSNNNQNSLSSSNNSQQTQINNTTNNQQKDTNIENPPSSLTSISNVAQQVVAKICETCIRLETEIKKYRNEISHMKQIENEMRQKIESNANTKSCLQAKQRENDELDRRIQELNNIRQIDTINIQNMERRLNDERRQKQSLEAQLNNEKKARKLAEEKASRSECSELCKQRKQQIEQEMKQLRREIKMMEDAKQTAELQGRKLEQELRMFEAEIRNRDAQQGTEVLMSALAAMQDKNSTLEKNLSSETRVKLDLFSALGEAKRQLEIKDSMVRNKDNEVIDLKAKIAQLLAVMPTDSLCLPPSSAGSSMLRINDTPPLQGPSSPMLNLCTSHQHLLAAAHQMNSRNGSSIGTVTSSASLSISSNNNLAQTSSNLDPNATAYTPKNSSLVGGTDA